MWLRSELKSRAKRVLGINYWKAFAMSLLLVLIGGQAINSGPANQLIKTNVLAPIEVITGLSLLADDSQIETYEYSQGNSYSYDPYGGSNYDYGSSDTGITSDVLALVITFFAIFGFLFVFGIVFVFGLKLFLYNPLKVGMRRYFLESSVAVESTGKDVAFSEAGFAFREGHYMNIVKTMFFRSLYLLGWSILFFIPAIVKGYAYSMVPYILSDNPKINRKRAIEISNLMTRGEKFRIFVMDLSFIGWYILGFIACFIGIFFVHPYYNSAHAELYRALRQKALDQGICSYEELNFQEPTFQEADFQESGSQH